MLFGRCHSEIRMASLKQHQHTYVNVRCKIQLDHLVQRSVDVSGPCGLQIGRGDVEGALDVVEVAAAHSLGPAG